MIDVAEMDLREQFAAALGRAEQAVDAFAAMSERLPAATPEGEAARRALRDRFAHETGRLEGRLVQAEELRRMRVELLEVDRRSARLLAEQASEALEGLTYDLEEAVQ